MTRTWFVTGSSAGFGQALARAALGVGDNVVATARRPDALASLVATAPERALAVAVDVTDRVQIDAAVAAATERFGGVDVRVKRLNRGIEATAYFVGCEGLTNVIKHAAASTASLTAVRHNGSVVVSVTDDGRGGAVKRSGSGLGGLADQDQQAYWGSTAASR
jgi:NADP-dependent 3-hydroxy acid dehydrogenase YdfG